jgi:maleylpyruvate isomerase
VSPGVTEEAPQQRLERDLGWMDRGTEFFAAQLVQVSDALLSRPSRLPGWTRLHVVSHMARNARALTNLLRWAETGVESPMYPSPEHRRDDIEAGAQLPAAEVRADAMTEIGRFRDSIAAMPGTAWSAEVKTALGKPIPASEIPWMRGREVWVHGVDLGASGTFADIDEDVAAALLGEAAERLAGREDCPAVVLVSPGSGDTRLAIGPDVADPLEARGTTQALAGWLLGRTAGAGIESPGPLPDLPPWL